LYYRSSNDDEGDTTCGKDGVPDEKALLVALLKCSFLRLIKEKKTLSLAQTYLKICA
jgi:hypothetical protein